MALAGTTWTMNTDAEIMTAAYARYFSGVTSFVSNGNTYSQITAYAVGKYGAGVKYNSTPIWINESGITPGDYWVSDAYRTITINTISSYETELETWLNSNAVQQVETVEYLTTNQELTTIANAIRTKGGTSASLVYPTGFVSAINSISTGTDVSDTTATASDVRTGKYFYTANGTKTQGTIQDQAAQTITPGTTDQTIASGKYLTGTQTIKGDADLVAGNIKSGTTIFGVTGTYSGGGGSGIKHAVYEWSENAIAFVYNSGDTLEENELINSYMTLTWNSGCIIEKTPDDYDMINYGTIDGEVNAMRFDFDSPYINLDSPNLDNYLADGDQLHAFVLPSN